MEDKNKISSSQVWERFSYIACICFTGYPLRQKSISMELARIGLLERTNFFWDFPSPYTQKLAREVSISKYHEKMFPVGYNNYRAIKTAFELGFPSILVMEDDLRFLKEVSIIEKSVRMLPDDYELAMFDKNFPSEDLKAYRETNKPINEAEGIEWRHFHRFHSSGCYAMSAIGMRKFIEAYETDGKMKTLKNNDQYFSDKVFEGRKMYASFPNVAIQSIVGKEGHLSPLQEYWCANEYQGGKQEMYNIEYPYITKDNFIPRLYQATRRSVQSHISNIMSSQSLIYCGLPKGVLKGINSIIKDCTFNDDVGCDKYNATIIWGNGTIAGNINALQIAYRDNIPVILCEDGFIRSYTTWVDTMASSVHLQSHSFLFDNASYYFDATRISNIEKMLNTYDLIVSPEQQAEAHRLINKIVANKVSKYNHQPIFTPKIGREGVRKVLVVDQSYGDFAIKLGMADDSTFQKMLDYAIIENPDADIIVKTHPDTIAGKNGEKKGYYQDIKEHNNIYKVTFPINPYSLMELCDKVYVVSSQFGLEALMAGKEVHVFGMPFYAGWGLTIDDQHLDRRTNKRTLEELFYIFYCMYTHWVDPDKGCEITIDAVIDKMIKLREEYQKNQLPQPPQQQKSGDIHFSGYRLGHRRGIPIIPRSTNW